MNEQGDSKRFGVKSISSALKRYANLNKPSATTKKRGGLNEITDLRQQTAKLLDKPIEQVYGLTKGWSKHELYVTLKTAKDFVNPPALWWKLYKQKKNIYGKSTNKKRNTKRALQKTGKERGESKCKEARQSALF